MLDLDAVILCGGLGKRLRSTIGGSQKVMARVDDEPFLNIQIKYLKSYGISRIILCTGYKSEEVEEYYQKNDLGVEIVFSPEEEPLGTGGAVKNAASLIQSPNFFAMNGDVIFDINLQKLFEFHQKKEADATLSVAKMDDVKDYGTIILDEDLHVTAFLEKQDESQTNFVNAGLYCFKKETFNLMPEGKKFSMEYDVFPLLTKKRLFGFVVEGDFHDIGTPERFEQAKGMIKK